MSFRDVEQRMRDRLPKRADVVPAHEGEGEYDFEASEERLRRQRYKQGWWILAGGALLVALFLIELFSSPNRGLVIDLRLGLGGAFALIGGIAALVIYRRRPLPKAVLRKR